MRTLLLTAIFMFASSASAGLYKWVDSEGNVHYSQKPPRNQQFKRLKAPVAAPENAKPLYQQSGDTPVKGATGNTEAIETAKNKKIRAENCAKAKKNLNAYQVYRRFQNKDGSVNIISDTERASQIEKAKQAISDFCN